MKKVKKNKVKNMIITSTNLLFIYKIIEDFIKENSKTDETILKNFFESLMESNIINKNYLNNNPNPLETYETVFLFLYFKTLGRYSFNKEKLLYFSNLFSKKYPSFWKQIYNLLKRILNKYDTEKNRIIYPSELKNINLTNELKKIHSDLNKKIKFADYLGLFLDSIPHIKNKFYFISNLSNFIKEWNNITKDSLDVYTFNYFETYNTLELYEEYKLLDNHSLFEVCQSQSWNIILYQILKNNISLKTLLQFKKETEKILENKEISILKEKWLTTTKWWIKKYSFYPVNSNYYFHSMLLNKVIDELKKQGVDISFSKFKKYISIYKESIIFENGSNIFKIFFLLNKKVKRIEMEWLNKNEIKKLSTDLDLILQNIQSNLPLNYVYLKKDVFDNYKSPKFTILSILKDYRIPPKFKCWDLVGYIDELDSSQNNYQGFITWIVGDLWTKEYSYLTSFIPYLKSADTNKNSIKEEKLFKI